MRGTVYWRDAPRIGRKPYLVVSNNLRNIELETALVVRITTADRAWMPTAVRLNGAREPLGGFVVCDDITTVRHSELRDLLGTLSSGAMARVTAGLVTALGLG